MSENALEQIKDSLASLDGNVVELTRQALADGVNPVDLLNDGLLKGLLEVGDRWNRQEYFISQVLYAAQMFQEASELITPYLVSEDGPKAGKIVMGTVEGDIHDIGKNLVITMLKANNFEVFDIGVDAPPQKFIDKAKEVGADIIGCSLIMSIAMPKMAEVIKLAHEGGLWPKTKVMIGGAPITEAVKQQIGADAWAPNAPLAAQEALKLVKEA